MLAKKRIKEMAEYINGIEKGLDVYRGAENPSQYPLFTEYRGAYFAALKMAEIANVKYEVHEMRIKLKEEK